MAFYRNNRYKRNYSHYRTRQVNSHNRRPHLYEVGKKPEKSEYDLHIISDEKYNYYLLHPNVTKRYSSNRGRLPIIIFWCFLFVAFLVTSEWGLPINVYLICLGGSIVISLMVYLFFRKKMKGVEYFLSQKRSYDKYAKDLQEYTWKITRNEESMREYEERQRLKQEKLRLEQERQEKVKKENEERQQLEERRQEISRNYIMGSASMIIQLLTAELKNTKVFQPISRTEWLQMSPRQFEISVGDVYRRMGYGTKVTQQSSDGGYDVIAHKNGRTKIIQCKHYSHTNLVGVKEIREFYGVCRANEVTGDFVYTSNLTAEAFKFLSDFPSVVHPVSLINLMEYDKMSCENLASKTIISLPQNVRDYLNDNSFIDCGYFGLLSQLFESQNAANQKAHQFSKIDSIHYVVVPYKVNSINGHIYYIVCGDDEAIQVLSMTKEICDIY